MLFDGALQRYRATFWLGVLEQSLDVSNTMSVTCTVLRLIPHFVSVRVQEYVLARKIEVWSGKIKISGDVLAWLYKHKRQWIDGSEYEYPAMRILFSRLDRLERLASGESRQTSVEGYDEFRQLIGRFGDHILCDDPRDRLYALLSLLSPEGREQLSITPDYTKSTLEIFKQIVEFARISEETHIRSEYIFRWVFSVTQQMLRLSDEEVATHLHKAS
jgi:hypothetical protein